MPSLRRTLPERALAWLYTGPAGQFYSVCADVLVLWPRAMKRGR